MSEGINSDIDIDIESEYEEPKLTRDKGKEKEEGDIHNDEEPSTPTPETLSKETRKLRKKKQVGSDEEVSSKKQVKKSVLQRSISLVRAENKKRMDPVSVQIKQEHDDDEEEDGEGEIKSPIISPSQMEDEIKQEDNEEEKIPMTPRQTRSSSQFYEDEEIDDVDTDDLLEEIDQLPPLRKKLTTRKRTLRKTRSTLSRKSKQAASLAMKTDLLRKYLKKQPDPYDPEKVKQLSLEHPDTYWQFHADSGYSMMNSINADNPVRALPYDVSDQGAITGMTLSKDGMLLATFSNIGSIKIWDITDDFRLVRKIRDTSETQIDEFYCGQFVGDGLLVSGGKLKDRHRWSAEDGDNHILPCPIKVFQIENCERVALLEGHTEEILCIKAVIFKGENYYVSTSQDGYIIKWHMDETWTKLIDSSPMRDGVTCMAFTVSFVPNTGNKFFIAACDEHLRLYDFEQAMLLQTFEDMYSSYCDCGKFVNWIDQPSPDTVVEDMEKQVNELSVSDNIKLADEPMQIDIVNEAEVPYAWFISRGAEMCDVSDGVSSKPNTCTLHKLIYPTTVGGKFKLETVKKYMHEDYHSNSWLVKITSNGRYILAPTIYGQIFVFNMTTGKVSAMIKEHEDLEVRDVIFHPYRPLIFSCGDDGYVKVYTYDDEMSTEQ